MKKLIIILLSLLAGQAFCFERVPTQTLLMAYLENDVELKNLTLAAQKAELSLEYEKVSQGVDVKLSSGNVTLVLSDDGSKISASPSLKMSVPQASNLTLTAETDLLKSSDENFDVSDTSLSLGVDLISTTGVTRKVALLKAQRSYQLALRNLQNQALETEKNFYTEYKSLLSSIKMLIKAEQTLYSDTIDFEEVVAKGYSSSSSTYRLAQMKVISDKHSIESYLRSLIHDYVLFYKNCGYDISLSTSQDYRELIPDDLEKVEPVDVRSFEKSLYAGIENAVWTNTINTLSRKTESSFSLAANGGYTFDNSATGSDTVDAGLTATIGGLALNAGVSVPAGTDGAGGAGASPAITMGLTLSPFTFKKNAIQKKQALLTEQQELLDIQSAESDYETYIVSAIQELEQIFWERNTAQESYEMYAKLAEELEAWFSQGIVTESEYLSAKTNAELYRVEILINMIDMIIYNDDVKCNFVSAEA